MSRLTRSALALGVLGSLVSSAASANQVDSPDCAAPRERIVGVPAGADVQALAASLGAQVLDTFGPGGAPMATGGPGQVARLVWPSTRAAERAHAYLQAGGSVQFAERMYRTRMPELGTCVDAQPVGAQQCTAAFVDGTPTLGEYEGQPLLPSISADDMPNHGTGAPAIVAVIDTGIDPTHSLFLGRLHGPGYDFLGGHVGGFDLPDYEDNDGDGLVDEAYGHGTHVAGLVCLIDPSARILPYRVLDSDGGGSTWDVANAIYRAIADGADVINLSLGIAQPSVAIQKAIDAAHAHEIVVVSSAGNLGGPTMDPLASGAHVLAVAAVDHDGVLAPFSSYGHKVDLVAPGVGLYSAYPGNTFAWWSGTSMSCAVVSGAVARLKVYDGENEVEHAPGALEDTALDVGQINAGLGDLLGDGLIRLDAAANALD
ncbi:MAG: S8 family serine peptidase [Planctomycetes bacterium]|nr:S8 family serine peptidase [Planctomycetota bacterium]